MAKAFQHIVIIGHDMVDQRRQYHLLWPILSEHLADYEPTSTWLVSGGGNEAGRDVSAMYAWLRVFASTRGLNPRVIQHDPWSLEMRLVELSAVLDRHGAFIFFCDAAERDWVKCVVWSLFPNAVVVPIRVDVVPAIYWRRRLSAWLRFPKRLIDWSNYRAQRAVFHGLAPDP